MSLIKNLAGRKFCDGRTVAGSQKEETRTALCGFWLEIFARLSPPHPLAFSLHPLGTWRLMDNGEQYLSVEYHTELAYQSTCPAVLPDLSSGEVLEDVSVSGSKASASRLRLSTQRKFRLVEY